MTWCVRRVVQRKQICQLDTHLDYNNLGTTITTCRLFTIESVDNQQSRREHVHSINKYQKLNVSRLPLLESYNQSRLSHRSGRPSTRIGYRQTGISRCVRTLRSYHGAVDSYDHGGPHNTSTHHRPTNTRSNRYWRHHGPHTGDVTCH